MKQKVALFAAGLLGITALAAYGSRVGTGVPKPFKKPVSLREGSVRPGVAGTTPRHSYFVGRGLRGGK